MTAAAARHKWQGATPPQPPDARERASYAWRALPMLTAGLAASALCVAIAQLEMEAQNAGRLPVPSLVFAGYTAIYLVYQAVSLPVNFTGRSFPLAEHEQFVAAWQPAAYPDVDVFLPICGEPAGVLRNTWEGVTAMAGAYPGMVAAWVLDDGGSDEAAAMAEAFGFSYVRRRNMREHKKSGNLNHAFAFTSGEHIVIFDADFRPSPRFLAETLPYMDDGTVGIVQTPQFFRCSPRQPWVERAAGATLEIFYRAVQVSRDRFGSALCVGSNAVYRRAALEPGGGFTQIPYAEDSHTGLDARRAGYRLKYIPVPLAAGICPATLDAFMGQQYRWCCGATSLVWTRHMWSVPMPLVSRLPFVAGWLWNLTTALRTLLLPLIPVTLLALVPGEVQLRNAILLIPPIITGVALYPLWHNAPYSPRIWPLQIAVGWAQALALWDYARGKVMSWQPTRGPKDATRRFWWGVTCWNAPLAMAWLGLAAYRLMQTGSSRFAAVLVFGLVNAAVTFRLVFPGGSQ